MERNERTLTGLKLRYYLDKLGAEGLVKFLDAYVPRGETNAERAKRDYEKTPFATPEELALLAELRGLPRNPHGPKTFGQVYNEGGLGETMNGNKYKNPTLQRIDELSRLQGARLTRSGGRKATRRRRQRVRQTRRK